MSQIQIGAHLSVAKGLPGAAWLAKELDLDFFQYFTRNPRGGAVRALTGRELKLWQEACLVTKLAPPVAHIPYTVNLAAEGGKPLDFAARVLRDDLARAARFGVSYVVAHPGHHTGNVNAAIARIVKLLASVEQIRKDTGPLLLLETMAGQGREIGGRLEELAAVLEGLDWFPGVGICLDSAHLFAAGWDLRQGAELNRLAETLDKLVGRERVYLLHLNDSQTDLGSRRDRHELIGKGKLGAAGIIAIVTHPFFRQLPMILETTVADYRDYGKEAAYVRQMAAKPSLRKLRNPLP